MEKKTFTEVMANIKKGEIWESNDKTIKADEYGITITHNDTCKFTNDMFISKGTEFRVKIQGVPFMTAIGELKAGATIESLETGTRYRIVNGEILCKLKYSNIEVEYSSFMYEEIIAQWSVIK